MSRRLDIGCAVYGKPQQLQQTVAAIQKHSVTDWRLFLINNPHPRESNINEVICGLADRDPRIVPVWMDLNAGYAGAVNEFMGKSTSEYIAYVDDDATINTPAWDETLCGYLDRFHEIGIVFPNGGAYPINRGAYTEIQWGVGFCWVLSRLCKSEVGWFDQEIGHQQEADYCMRVRMAGWKCAAAPEVNVSHAATASNDPASNERIAKGVRDFVNKWCRYFCGKNVNYHSPNVLRWEDWPPNALYMEEYWKLRDPSLNASPQVVTMDGREYDLIRVPRFKDFYRNRVI